MAHKAQERTKSATEYTCPDYFVKPGCMGLDIIQLPSVALDPIPGSGFSRGQSFDGLGSQRERRHRERHYCTSLPVLMLSRSLEVL
eukprot:2795995-Pyramimonas_sp.AAC.1